MARSSMPSPVERKNLGRPVGGGVKPPTNSGRSATMDVADHDPASMAIYISPAVVGAVAR